MIFLDNCHHLLMFILVSHIKFKDVPNYKVAPDGTSSAAAAVELDPLTKAKKVLSSCKASMEKHRAQLEKQVCKTNVIRHFIHVVISSISVFYYTSHFCPM